MKDKIWAWIIGTGFVLFAIHNPLQPLKEYAFLPVVGLTFSLLGMFVILTDRRKEITLGNKKIWIPLAVISASIAGSGFLNPVGEGVQASFAPMLFGIYLFGAYLTGRVVGKELFRPFAWAVVIGTLGLVAWIATRGIGYYDNIYYDNIKSGGYIISPTNYDIATGLLVFGTIVSIWQKQWILTAIALVGLFLTGADEALFVCGVLFVVILARRDWSRKVLLPVGALVLTLAICTPLAITQNLYYPTAEKAALTKEAIEDTPVGHALDKVIPSVIVDAASNFLEPKVGSSEAETTEEYLEEATGYRWLTHWRIPPIKPLGYGYTITGFYHGIPHNVPLIITHQVGVVAVIAWCWVTLFCLVRTKWKYAFVGVLALSVFDHFIWTQVAPWWWVLVGVATASSIKSDYIFKEVSNE